MILTLYYRNLMIQQKMIKKMISQYLNSIGPSFIHEEDDKKELPPPSCSDVKPQYVHHLALQPPPEVSHSIPKHEDVKQRCVKFTVACLLLLLLVVGILLVYYFSSTCVHGMQCGDGSCVWETQWCDGVTDCPAGQDEDNCVRLHGSGFLLQIYSTQSKDWRTVCSHGWTDQQGSTSCQSIGYSRGTYFKSGQQQTDSDGRFLIVKSDFNPQVSILQQLHTSNMCPNNSVVTLHCTDCGHGVNSSKASRAQQASVGSWPWHVSLQVVGSHRCGGALISPYWIVTAAHCVNGVSSPADWAVYAGIVDPSSTLFSPAYSVSGIIVHEGFNSLTRSDDIALLRLSKPLDIKASSNIGPVCLPNVGLNVTVPENGWITQFGHQVNGGSGSSYLMEAQVSLIDAAECNHSTAYIGRISQDMFCATETDAGARLCYTDSGGPLVSLMDGLWWLVGDNILGGHCTGKNKPGVYGNITQSLGWIYQQMKKHQND
ncbi:transmembrane protease serine 2-like isoform X2 [Parambassis ranga]|uniref:Transmembrane protease serine 2-like isoform X2 n=1 Tax=Parambassis ranga TaxID=210632 RepID=A0A6P7JCF4_9TELE|nr:transmembrane protease serine 2-like isoform X2 [Parambassis ranga]